MLGPDVLAPWDSGIYYVENAAPAEWEVTAPAGLIEFSIDSDNKLHIDVIYGKSYKAGFDIKYGDLTKHIVIKSL